MKIVNNSDSVIIVLHEIYGINNHIQRVCQRFSNKGFDIICPNLIRLQEPFRNSMEKEAYHHFINNIGFDTAATQVKEIIKEAKNQYKSIYLVGYSIGATIGWLCSNKEDALNGIVGYYGSRIRDYLDVVPKCPSLLIYPTEEASFNVKELADTLKKQNIKTYILEGKHGFANPYSNNYSKESFEISEKLVDDFIEKV